MINKSSSADAKLSRSNKRQAHELSNESFDQLFTLNSKLGKLVDKSVDTLERALVQNKNSGKLVDKSLVQNKNFLKSFNKISQGLTDVAESAIINTKELIKQTETTIDLVQQTVDIGHMIQHNYERSKLYQKLLIVIVVLALIRPEITLMINSVNNYFSNGLNLFKQLSEADRFNYLYYVPFTIILAGLGWLIGHKRRN